MGLGQLENVHDTQMHTSHFRGVVVQQRHDAISRLREQMDFLVNFTLNYSIVVFLIKIKEAGIAAMPASLILMRKTTIE